jgi:hypothetical protein
MMRRLIIPILILLSALLAARVLGEMGRWVAPHGVVAAFYRGTNFEDLAWITTKSDLKWTDTRPLATRLSHEPFSARYDGWLSVPESGEYSFAALSQDGIRLFIDDEAVIDSWRSQKWADSKSEAVKRLEKGKHRLRVEFHGSLPDARFRVEWCGGPVPPRTILGSKYLTKRYGKHLLGGPLHGRKR